MTALLPLAPTVTVGGTELALKWLDTMVGLRVERALGLVGRATLRFVDEGYALSTQNLFALGADVRIGIHEGGRLMLGTVTGVSLEQRIGDHPELIVVVDDAAYKLSRGSQVRTFLNVSYTDALRTVINESGLAADIDVSDAGTSEYLLQAGSNLAFLDSVTERIGHVWWVDGASGSTMLVKPAGTSTGTVTLALTDTLDEFAVQASGLRPNEVSVNGWDPNKQENVVGKRQTPRTDAQPGRFAAAYIGSSAALGTSAVTASDRHPVTAQEADAFATAMLNDWAAGAVVARGTCRVDEHIKPGVTVAVQSAGPASGSYLVSRVEHSYTSSGFRTRFVAGSHRPNGLVDTLGRAPSPAGLSVDGMVIGLVTNIGDPDKLGRVKVKYIGISGAIESPWARVVTLGAGSNRGVLFQPEVNDEVLVAFERSDPRRPLVIGGLYSQQNSLPDWGVKGSEVSSRRITSRVGHVIELSDSTEAGKSFIGLRLGTAEHKLVLSSDSFEVEVAANKPVTIKAGSAKFEITASGDVSIEGKNVTIKAQQALQLEGTTGATLKSSAQANVEGAQVGVKANGMASIDGGGNLSLKGGLVAIN